MGQNVVRTCPRATTRSYGRGGGGHTPAVRRALGTIFLTLGLLSASLALSAWWVQHTAFDTANTSTIAEAAFQNPELRADLARGIADRVATELGVDHALVQSAADATLVRPEIANAFASVLRDIHSRLIGQTTGPVIVSPELVARAIGNPAASQLAPVSIDIPTFDALNTTRKTLHDVIPILIYVAVVLVFLGVLIHSSKPAALRVLGAWFLAASVIELLVAYALPVLVLPALVDSPYADLVAEVDKATLGPLVGVLIMLAGAGVACLVAGAWLDRPDRPQPRAWGAAAPSRW